MSNTLPEYTNLEATMGALDAQMRMYGPDRYLTMAVYAPSSVEAGSLFALSHTSKGAAHIRRSDQYVYRRRLNAQASIAAEIYGERKVATAVSRMFPDEHECTHIPLPSDDPDKSGLLQVVLKRQKTAGGRSPRNRSPLVLQPEQMKRIAGSYNRLVTGIPDLDHTFNVKASYAPNGILMNCDISGFSTMSYDVLGPQRAQDFADIFCKDYIRNIVQAHGAEILRYEGDGAWIFFPLGVHKTMEQARDQAIKTAKALTDGYESFARAHEKRFERTKLKIAFDAGEIETHPAISPLDMRIDTSPTFTHINQSLRTADRSTHSILIGPEIARTMPEANQSKARQFSFQRLTA